MGYSARRAADAAVEEGRAQASSVGVAALTLLPGVYASYHLVGIKLRWPGFDNVAMFHEDVQFV